jgi:hypothetical protein
MARPRLIEEEFLNMSTSSVDSYGNYTVTTYKRPYDSTTYMVSTDSNPDANGNYQTQTWQYYDIDGSTLISTRIWTITYDANGKLLTRTVN